MQQQEISAFLQSLRGSQALVVLAFLIVRQGMAVAELSAATGLNDDTVRTAIKALAKKGNLLRQRGAHGREVWIPAGQTLFALAGQNPKTSDSAAFQNPKTSDSGKILLSSSSVQADSLLLEEEEEEEGPESENFGLCLKACDAVGIREPKRSNISRLPHVTPEFIRAHARWAREQGVPLGSAIFRIEHDWMPPESCFREDVAEDKQSSGGAVRYSDWFRQFDQDEEHGEDCECVECRIAAPEKFCHFEIEHEAVRTSRSNSWRAWRSKCTHRVIPGQLYCAEHLQEMENQ